MIKSIAVECNTEEERREVLKYASKVCNDINYNKYCNSPKYLKVKYIRVSPGSPFGVGYGELGWSESDKVYAPGNICHSKVLTFKQFKNEYMENKRTVEISFETAKEWYNSDNKSLKAIALQAFKEDELKTIKCEDIIKELYSNKCVIDTHITCISYSQAEKLIAIKKLMDIAKYLNEDWIPDFKDSSSKYCIALDEYNIFIDSCCFNNSNICYFKTIELARQAIEILGEDTIRLALSTNY